MAAAMIARDLKLVSLAREDLELSVEWMREGLHARGYVRGQAAASVLSYALRRHLLGLH